MNWLSHSPDLKLIENYWRLLKTKIFGLHPEPATHGHSKVDWTDLHEAIKKAGEARD